MPIKAQSADGIIHEFPDGTDMGVVDRVMKDYATQHVAPEKTYLNEVGQPFTLSGKPVSQQPAASNQGYTGTILPLRRDESGFHLSAPEVLASPVRGAVTGGQRALGVGEAGQNPLRPLSPDQLAAVSVFADAPVGAVKTLPKGQSPLSPAQSLLQDFEKAGVTPNAPTIGQGRSAGTLSQMANVLPISGPQVRGAITRTLGETEEATERAAAGLGVAQGSLEAGEAAQRGVTQFAKGSFPATAEKLYSDFERQMPQGAPFVPANTMKALGGPISRFPSSPELGAQLTNPTLRSYLRAIEPSTKQIPASYSSILGTNGQPILLQAAQKIQRGGTLTFGEMKELRSTIGRALGDPVLVSDIPRADLKDVYAALSKDLESAARRQGPQALNAFRRANSYYKAGLERIDQVDDLLKGSPEQAFNKINRAAQVGAGADVGKLSTIKKTIGPQEWGNVGAAIVRKLGEPTPGAKDIIGEQFSPSSFATNWNKLSDGAKDQLFGPMTSVGRAGLETLSRISQAQKNVGKLANVSRSGEYGLMAGMAALAIEHYASLIQHPFATIGAGLGAYGTSKLLMSPGFARWLYALPSTVSNAPSLDVAAQRAIFDLGAAMEGGDQKKSPPSNLPSPIGTYDDPMYGIASGL